MRHYRMPGSSRYLREQGIPGHSDSSMFQPRDPPQDALRHFLRDLAHLSPRIQNAIEGFEKAIKLIALDDQWRKQRENIASLPGFADQVSGFLQIFQHHVG